MNETLILVLALVIGVLLGAIFFGGLWWTVRKVVSSKWPALLVAQQYVATNEHYPGRFLFYRGRSLGKAAGVPARICDCAPDRDAARPIGGKANLHGTGGQSCTSVPMK